MVKRPTEAKAVNRKGTQAAQINGEHVQSALSVVKSYKITTTFFYNKHNTYNQPNNIRA